MITEILFYDLLIYDLRFQIWTTLLLFSHKLFQQNSHHMVNKSLNPSLIPEFNGDETDQPVIDWTCGAQLWIVQNYQNETSPPAASEKRCTCGI